MTLLHTVATRISKEYQENVKNINQQRKITCQMRIKQHIVQVSVLNCINVKRNKYSTKYKTFLKF